MDQVTTINVIAAILFGIALIHTFSTKLFEILARLAPRHAGMFHLLGEVEVVFGFWSLILLAAMALLESYESAITYVESRSYTEPVFVFVIMVVAASQPVLEAVKRTLGLVARVVPLNTNIVQTWLVLGVLPVLGSFITEPAAMTLAALMLARQFGMQPIPEWLKYGATGVLFVNVSIGGTLTAYAAPPVLMVAAAWNLDTWHMLTMFGWKAASAVLVNATAITYLLRKHLVRPHPVAALGLAGYVADAIPGAVEQAEPKVSALVSLIHLMFLSLIITFAHHPVIFLGLFLLFIGYTRAYEQYQSPLIIREGLLVSFFLAGLVVLGGMQRWWLQPIVSGLDPLGLYFGVTALTAITDNAALTYLGSLIPDLSDQAKYMLLAGAVTGGGLTIIANAPNPAGAALLRRCFQDESIGAIGLLLGALLPTVVAILAFLLL